MDPRVTMTLERDLDRRFRILVLEALMHLVRAASLDRPIANVQLETDIFRLLQEMGWRR